MRGKSIWYESEAKRLRPAYGITPASGEEYPKTYNEAVLKSLIRQWEGFNLWGKGRGIPPPH
jgi:hypothetical protein